MPDNTEAPDTRVVYSINCSWWDSIDKCKINNAGLPGCPHCGSVLCEMPSEEVWWASVDRYEASGHPGYRKMIEWMRGKCYTVPSEKEAAYQAYLDADRDEDPEDKKARILDEWWANFGKSIRAVLDQFPEADEEELMMRLSDLSSVYGANIPERKKD